MPFKMITIIVVNGCGIIHIAYRVHALSIVIKMLATPLRRDGGRNDLLTISVDERTNGVESIIRQRPRERRRAIYLLV